MWDMSSKVVDCSKCNMSFKSPEGSCFNCPYEVSGQYLIYMKNKENDKKTTIDKWLE